MLAPQYQVQLPFRSGKISTLAFSIEFIKQPLIFVPQNHQKNFCATSFFAHIQYANSFHLIFAEAMCAKLNVMQEFLSFNGNKVSNEN